jgi:O-antigen/teichoic acid export membrane protein
MSVASPALAFLLIAFSSEKGYARIIGYATVNIVVGLFFLVFNQYKGKKMFDKDFWKYSLSFAIPLIPYYLSQVVFNQSDRIMIDKICGTDKAAIYSVAYTVALILNFVLNAINNSYVPWFYQAIKEKKWEESKKVASGISLLMAVLLLGIIWLAPEIIYIMAGKAYYEAVWIIPPVAMSLLLLFYAQLFINTAFYYEKKGFLVWASVWSAILNIVLNAIFIPMAGYVAAGYTTFVSYILFALLNYYGAQKHIKMDISMRNLYDLKVLTLIFAGFVVLSFGAMMLYSMFVVRYVVIAVTFVVVFLKRNTLINYLKMFKKNEVE